VKRQLGVVVLVVGAGGVEPGLVVVVVVEGGGGVVVVVEGEEEDGMDRGVPRKATLRLAVFADGLTSRRATKRSGRPQDSPAAESSTTPRKTYLVSGASLSVRRSDARSCTAPPGPTTSTVRNCGDCRQARASTETKMEASPAPDSA